MNPMIRTSAIAVLAVALLGTGCGGDDDSTDVADHADYPATRANPPAPMPDEPETWNAIAVTADDDSTIEVYDAKGQRVRRVPSGVDEVDEIQTRGSYALVEGDGEVGVVDLVSGEVTPVEVGGDQVDVRWASHTNAPIAVIAMYERETLIVDARQGRVIDAADAIGVSNEELSSGMAMSSFAMGDAGTPTTAAGNVVVLSSGTVGSGVATWLMPLNDPTAAVDVPGMAFDVTDETVLTYTETLDGSSVSPAFEFRDPTGESRGTIELEPASLDSVDWRPAGAVLLDDETVLWVSYEGSVQTATLEGEPTELTTLDLPPDGDVTGVTWLPEVERILVEIQGYDAGESYVLLDREGRIVTESDGATYQPAESGRYARCIVVSPSIGGEPTALVDARTGKVLGEAGEAELSPERPVDGCTAITTRGDGAAALTPDGTLPLPVNPAAIAPDGSALVVGDRYAYDLTIRDLTDRASSATPLEGKPSGYTAAFATLDDPA